jgi:hypothetical protein
MHQIKTTEIAKYRNMFAAKQKYICPLCNGPLAGQTITLDHDHVTGSCRAALCGTCNRSEGKVLKAAAYMAKLGHLSRTDVVQYLRNIATYIEHHRENPSNIIHPTYDLAKGKQKPVKRAVKRPVKRTRKKT